VCNQLIQALIALQLSI